MQRSSPSLPHFSRLCFVCEYDLTGLPVPCVCPECGARSQAGHWSIRVRPGRGGRSWIGFSIFIALALFTGLMTVTAVAGGFRGPDIVCSAMATLFFTALALVQAGAMYLHPFRQRRVFLHCSAAGIALSEGGDSLMYEWRHVRVILCRKACFGTMWVLDVRGFSQMRGTLLGAALPGDRRTAAHVRNTLRRHHRAWRAINVDSA